MTYADFFAEWRSLSSSIKVTTSGSTGKPKELFLPRRMMEESAWRTIDFFGLTSLTRFHSCISPDYIGGKMMAVRADILNAPFSFETPSNSPSLLTTYASGQIFVPDFIALVPSQLWGIFRLLDDLNISKDLKEKIRKSIILAGGGALNEELASMSQEYNLNVWETYGMTETSSHIALRKVGQKFFELLPGIEINTDSRGTLEISLPGFEKISTNDIAELNDHSGFRILGRIDNVIISGGKKIIAEEWEEKMRPEFRRMGITEYLAIGQPDKKWGEALTLLIKADINHRDMVESVESSCRNLLQHWEMPKQIKFISRIPKTSSGKPIRDWKMIEDNYSIFNI